MTTFYENPHYYSNQTKLEPSLAIPQYQQQQQQQQLDLQDFFVAYKSSPTDLCQDIDNWKYAVSELRQNIFNSTSVSFLSPEAYFIQRAKKNKHPTNELSALINSNGTFRFNSDPIYATDPLTYRRHRSENLLVRMIHCRSMDMTQVSLMRLSKGVFVHQKWQSSLPQPSPTLSCIEESMSNKYIDAQEEAPIDTFQFDNVCHMANNLTSSCYEMFIPYSYTFGARYTNPYNNAKDLVIRGKLPLWCQTLFLSVCQKQTEPIQANVSRLSLFPFAPHIAVTFVPLIQDETDTIMPELTIMYERYTMEDMDAFSSPETSEEELKSLWPERKKQLFQNILVCDIPDDLAKILSDMAVIWAASQGLML